MNIIIHAGYYATPWDSTTEGLGGTEQSIVNLSKQFALQGNSVYVVGNVNDKHDEYPDAGDVYYRALESIDELDDELLDELELELEELPYPYSSHL